MKTDNVPHRQNKLQKKPTLATESLENKNEVS